MGNRHFALLVLFGCALLAGGCFSRYLKLPEDPVKALGSDDPSIVALAALAVSRSADNAQKRAALQPLCKLLKHRDPLVRSAAARALRKITGRDLGYEPFVDPYEQEDLIGKWQDLADRLLEESR